MHIELYRIFYQVACVKNISRAAESLFITQPAVSKAIKHLESELSTILFIRSPKGVSLTTEGEFLFNYIEKAFKEIEKGEILLEKLKQLDDGLIRIGVSNTLCKYYFMPHLKSFHEKYPGIKIHIVNRTAPQIIQLVKQGNLDFGIVSHFINSDEVITKHLAEITDIFVSKDQWDKEQKVSLTELKNYGIMMLEKGSTTRQYIDSFLNECGVELNPEIEISSLDFLIEFALMGLGIAPVIREFVSSELASKRLFEIPIEPSIPKRSIVLIRQKEKPLSQAMVAFLKQLS